MSERVQAVSRLLYRKVGHTQKGDMVKRVKVSKLEKPNISTEAINFKAPHNAKTSQAWKYPNNNILRAPSVMINGTRYYDPKMENKDYPRRKQESNFFVTINTNQSGEDPESCDQVTRAMGAVLEHLKEDKVIARCIKFGPKHPEFYADDRYVDVVHSIDFKGVVETGHIMERVHAHIWITIHHYSQVQLNTQMLQYETKQVYNAALGPGHTNSLKKLPYVQIKLLPQSDWTDVMRQYIHKAMTA